MFTTDFTQREHVKFTNYIFDWKTLYFSIFFSSLNPKNDNLIQIIETICTVIARACKNSANACLHTFIWYHNIKYEI